MAPVAVSLLGATSPSPTRQAQTGGRTRIAPADGREPVLSRYQNYQLVILSDQTYVVCISRFDCGLKPNLRFRVGLILDSDNGHMQFGLFQQQIN